MPLDHHAVLTPASAEAEEAPETIIQRTLYQLSSP
eukprot:CAMPEP_0119376142 /NCGR_PEP_ID=MMETSP1334-20130426/39127_1 /TAXON_ID=127549 /ORGANISM="Calcidiscus leptoporus, Strain RCC1130" /LENGTH=34 /DNA_ID= /DNA_START= /DNA_END= /DNA_ORIENTATION=